MGVYTEEIYCEIGETTKSSTLILMVKKLRNWSRKNASKLKNSEEVTNNYEPLQFHRVHGTNIVLQNDKTIAKRRKCFSGGLAFTNRPVKPNEKISLKLLGLSENWNGVLRIGFTSYDPKNFKNNVPKFAVPNLTKTKGSWAKEVDQDLVQQDSIIQFHVTKTGEVYITKKGEMKKVPFLIGLDVSMPLWAIIDVYGNTTEVQLVSASSICRSPDNRPVSVSNCSQNVQSTTNNVINSQLEQRCYQKKLINRHSDIGVPAKIKNVSLSSVSTSVERFHRTSSTSAIANCILCSSRSADTCFYNCGHAVCCYNCAKELFIKRTGCPICGYVIRDITRLYKC